MGGKPFPPRPRVQQHRGASSRWRMEEVSHGATLRDCAEYYRIRHRGPTVPRRRKTLIPNRGRCSPLSLFRQVHLGEGHSKIKPPSPRSEVGSGPIPQTVESLLTTETKDTMINIPDDCGYQVVGYMMRSSESLQEARGRMQSHHTPDYSFSHPQRTIYIILYYIIL